MKDPLLLLAVLAVCAGGAVGSKYWIDDFSISD